MIWEEEEKERGKERRMIRKLEKGTMRKEEREVRLVLR